MNPEYDIEMDYQGISDDNLVKDQLTAAVQALHVLAVIQQGNPEWMANFALDALKEIETLGYSYENFREILN
jgi:hypothetical protein